MIKECRGCGKLFVPSDYRRVFCSRGCNGKILRRRYETQCQWCGKKFECPFSRKEAKFCSIECRSSSYRGTLKIPLGTERLQKGYYGLEWYVKVKQKGWVRKAVLVLEALLGRVLTGAEARVQFVDGNRLNCNPSNLYLPGFELIVCRYCLRQKVVSASINSHLKSPDCKRCSIIARNKGAKNE